MLIGSIDRRNGPHLDCQPRYSPGSSVTYLARQRTQIHLGYIGSPHLHADACLISYVCSGQSLAAYSSKKDLILVSYASPNPSGVTVILSLLQISSIPEKPGKTHISVAPCFSEFIYLISLFNPIERANKLTDLTLPFPCIIHWDMFVC
jgi:hypothetical protein